ncbi:MAG: carbohydrate binding domain-containing protein [Armatimonadetes bacterium]|nr:carbohydrate binding domain-containing protein [Armatimonadota bacterium]MDW8121674.1 carbohydrate binding domain-containing protein [Armatimonadota bacterium]
MHWLIRLLFFSFVAALAPAALVLSALAPDDTINLLKNPSFEAEGDWDFYGFGAKGVHFFRSTESRSGYWCAAIKVEKSGAIDWYQWRQRIDFVKVGATYRLSGWVRADKVHRASGAYISLSAYDDHGRRLLFCDASRINGTRDWFQLSVTLTVPKDTAYLLAACVLHGYGQAFFDDLSLEEVKPIDDREIIRRWQKMRERGEWLFVPRPVSSDELALPITPDVVWKQDSLYGWLSGNLLEQWQDGLLPSGAVLLQVPLDAMQSETLRLSLPKGDYFLHIWFGGSVGTRIPLNVKVNGKLVLERIFVITPSLFRLRIVSNGSWVDVTFEPSCKPVPVGEKAPSVSILAVAVTSANRPIAPSLLALMRERDQLLEATVNPIATHLPKVKPPSVFPVTATQVCPDMRDLKREDALTITASRGETISGGVLLLLEPEKPFKFTVQGDIPDKWLRLLVGVPGWVRMAGTQRWDFWLSPARWLDEKQEGRTSMEGLGLAWIQIAVPESAAAKQYKATLRVFSEKRVLSIPIHLNVLPLILPEVDADIGMFYNATMNLSCPDDQLVKRWRMHLADMKANGMTSVFIYTFRMLWHQQINGQWEWRDEVLTEFLRAYRAYFDRPLYICTHGDRFHPQGYGSYVKHVKERCHQLGLEVFFMPVDEAYATEELLKDAENWVRIVSEADGNVAMTTDHREAESLNEWLNVRVYGAGFVNEEVIRHTQASGDVFAVYNGGSAGDPFPVADRFFFGIYPWATGAKGVFQWAYQWGEGNPLDERDAASHDWCYTLPVGEKLCAPTLNWEAVREGISDWRYLLAVEKLAQGTSQVARKARKVLSDAKSDMESFLRRNNHIRYGDAPSFYPYERLISAYSPERLMNIRQQLMEVLLEAYK